MRASLINMSPLIAHKIRFGMDVSNEVRGCVSVELKSIISNTTYHPIRFTNDMVEIIRDTLFDELEKL
jgi:hypothetical protein